MALSSDLQAALEALHKQVADVLKARLDGEPTVQEINAAIKFLKDNDITIVPSADNPLGDLGDKLQDAFKDLPSYPQ